MGIGTKKHYAVYCPQATCEGHRMTKEQLQEEDVALRPYAFSAAPPNNKYRDPRAPLCFRHRDEMRANGQWPRPR
jgi:hypothetical protein